MKSYFRKFRLYGLRGFDPIGEKGLICVIRAYDMLLHQRDGGV
jgi:hypothetical protein